MPRSKRFLHVLIGYMKLQYYALGWVGLVFKSYSIKKPENVKISVRKKKFRVEFVKL